MSRVGWTQDQMTNVELERMTNDESAAKRQSVECAVLSAFAAGVDNSPRIDP